ncbi:hypothetical protein IRZ83_18860 [Flavobacterium sp. JLP]|uniref:hypothetical protein n=1 Tax=unclassified Flavobacterium TaxID=196869 RepID=UPI00188C43CD|nr:MULTISPECIES: hypothetical protein [unclassified Flavobacterium]MBF4494401.1 hypothetical protein [Flavobacterium sp. MR2016-29]MBF4508740.1 hypothetical protein [Flavobacterium sp. JLP]
MKIIKNILFIILFQFAFVQASHAQFGGLTDKVLEAGASLASKKLGVDKILKQPAAITTSFEDVNQEGSKMPDFSIADKAQPLYLLPKAPDGGFVLCAGLYEMTNKSYCLHAGTFAPSQGDGYMFAPVLGPKEEIVTAILKSAEKHPEINQHDIQVLLWTIIARTKFADYNGTVKLTAIALLTPLQLTKLEGGVLGVLPGNLMDKAMDKLPDNLKAIFEAENKIRQMVSSGNYTYDEMEKYAILAGIAPARTDIPSGIWTLHPDGYYVRYFPSGYSKTRVQVYVPKELILSLNGTKIIYDATNDIACPANVGSQRLAQTNEPLDPDYKIKLKTLCAGIK